MIHDNGILRAPHTLEQALHYDNGLIPDKFVVSLANTRMRLARVLNLAKECPPQRTLVQ